LPTDFFKDAKGLDFPLPPTADTGDDLKPPTADKGDPAGELDGSGVDRDLRTDFFQEAKGLSFPLERGSG